MTTLDAALSNLSATDVSFRLANGLFKVLPGAPELAFYGSLGEAHALVNPGANLARAQAFAASEPAIRALKVADAIDYGDMGISVYTGISSALKFFFGSPEKKKSALETDPQQGADAALKALAIAYLGSQLFEGTIPERVAAMHATDAGKALLYYYGAVEVALPFTDDVLSGSGSVLSKLMDKFGASNMSKLNAAAGAGAAQEAMGMMASLSEHLDGVITKAAKYTGPVAEAGKKYLPGALGTADKVAGAVATGADALPMYRLLGARLVAEAALVR